MRMNKSKVSQKFWILLDTTTGMAMAEPVYGFAVPSLFRTRRGALAARRNLNVDGTHQPVPVHLLRADK